MGTRGTKVSLYQVASPWHCQLIGQDRDHACTSFFSPSYPSSSSLVLEILWIVNNIFWFCDWPEWLLLRLYYSGWVYHLCIKWKCTHKTPQTLHMKGPSCGYQGRWRVVCYVICTTQFPLQLCEAVFASWIWQQFWSLNNIYSLQALVTIHTDGRIGSRKTGSPYNPNYSHRKRQQQQKSTSHRPRPWILPPTSQPSSTVSNGVSKVIKIFQCANHYTRHWILYISCVI